LGAYILLADSLYAYKVRHLDPRRLGVMVCYGGCCFLSSRGPEVHNMIVGFSSLQKCIAALMMFAYGAPGDAQDDYIRMAESIDMIGEFGMLSLIWDDLTMTNVFSRLVEGHAPPLNL
jgi:hypothetical protein